MLTDYNEGLHVISFVNYILGDEQKGAVIVVVV